MFPATVINRPDKVEMMKTMAKMDMKMGAPALKANTKKYNTPQKLAAKYGMKMDHMNMESMNMNQMDMEHEDMKPNAPMQAMDSSQMSMMHKDSTMMHPNNMEKDAMHMNHVNMENPAKTKEQNFDYAERKTYFNYDF